MPKDNTFEPIHDRSEDPLAQVAAMVARGFEDLRREIRELDLGLREEIRVSRKEMREFQTEVRHEFEGLEERAFPTPYEREDLEARLSLVEKTLGIESGK